MHRRTVYMALREEILDQRKCQFQMYTISAGLAPAALLIADKSGVGGVVFLGPMVFYVAALLMVLQKEVSIFRKVGYLQLLETHEWVSQWHWENDIDAFRRNNDELTPKHTGRHHTYAKMVCTFILLLMTAAAVLYKWYPAPEGVKPLSDRAEGALDVVAAGLLGFSVGFAIHCLRRLERGPDSSDAIRCKWMAVLGTRLTRPLAERAA